MPERSSRVVWLDYLRGFITVLVVAHHSSLAYTTFAAFNKNAYILSTHPVVDTVRARALDIFEDFNDVFFMSLMFLISGIFVLPALERKGAGNFLRDRFRRLFIPFLIGVTVLMPIAYLPAWHLAKQNWHPIEYLVDFFTVEAWPVGPPWFIWVLFAFNGILAIAYRPVRPALIKGTQWLARFADRPVRLWLGWLVFTGMIYIPIVLLAGPDTWTGLGPFDFQVSRVLLYFGYFLLGVLIGGRGPAEGLLAPTAGFHRKAPLLVVSCALAYILLKCSAAPQLIYRSIWALSCTASSIAFLSVFSRLFRRASPIWDSLSANAYGIYLVHYIFVVWIQWLLLPLALPALLKFAVTFLCSLLLSWGVTAAARKNALVARYL
jgi:glucan biosynthesis protein C